MIALLNQFFPKCDEKLLAGLKVGGIALYKELSSYVGAFPYTRFTPQ